MATEFSRETSVRKVCPDPSDNATHVKLKVLDKISFIDAKSQYQEYQFSFNNTPTADRVTHSEKAGDELDVERIDKLSVIDAKDYFQESLFSFLRYQEGVHLKTHKAKIYALNSDGTKDEGIWIEVERVDQISFVDPKAQYQEYIYELKWPDLADPEWDYQDLAPVVTDYDNTTINPPWRMDPFQNIINSSFGDQYLLITFSATYAASYETGMRARVRTLHPMDFVLSIDDGNQELNANRCWVLDPYTWLEARWSAVTETIEGSYTYEIFYLYTLKNVRSVSTDSRLRFECRAVDYIYENTSSGVSVKIEKISGKVNYGDGSGFGPISVDGTVSAQATISPTTVDFYPTLSPPIPDAYYTGTLLGTVQLSLGTSQITITLPE